MFLVFVIALYFLRVTANLTYNSSTTEERGQLLVRTMHPDTSLSKQERYEIKVMGYASEP